MPSASQETVVLQVLKHVEDMFNHHTTEEMARYKSISDSLEEHKEQSSKRHEDFMAKLRDAFPGADLEAHREAHEAWMQEVSNRADFWKKMKFELVKWGLLGFLGWALTQLIKAALQGKGLL